ncbi:MAG: hypothetical protein U0805_03505 [Pirellulales bacterium]
MPMITGDDARAAEQTTVARPAINTANQNRRFEASIVCLQKVHQLLMTPITARTASTPDKSTKGGSLQDALSHTLY